MGDKRYFRNAPETLLLLSAVAVHVVLGWWLELAPDEAYYWEWSRRLAAGYFDHPPAIAWSIAAGTTLLGRSSLGVRLVPILMSGLTCWLAFLTAQQLFADKARARHVLAIMLIMPMGLVGGVLATPDAPLGLGWALALWGLAHQRRATSPAGWAAVACGTGLACLSKYTGFILLGSVGIVCIVEPAWRRQFRGPAPWLAIVGTLTLIYPTLAWNLAHGGTSLAFQLKHGLASSRSGGLAGMSAFVAGQLGVASPVVAYLCARFWAKTVARTSSPREPEGLGVQDESSDALRLLWWLSAPLVGVMLLAALRTRGEPNWPAPAYLGAVIAVPWPSLRSSARWAAQGTAMAISGILLLQATLHVLPLSGRIDPTSQLYGWPELARAVSLRSGPNQVVVTERYQEAAELAFELDPHFVVTALAGRGRIDQYDLWPSVKVPRGTDILWLNRAGTGSAPPFAGFESIGAPVRISVGRPGQTRDYDLYQVRKALTDWSARLQAAP